MCKTESISRCLFIPPCQILKFLPNSHRSITRAKVTNLVLGYKLGRFRTSGTDPASYSTGIGVFHGGKRLGLDVHLGQMLVMSGVIILLLLYAFLTWRATTFMTPCRLVCAYQYLEGCTAIRKVTGSESFLVFGAVKNFLLLLWVMIPWIPLFISTLKRNRMP